MGTARTRVGDRLGPYLLESVMAETAMAAVYAALDERTGIAVCVKTVHPLRRWEETLVRRFRREARVAMLLTNPNTVRVLDHGVADDGTLFLVMELLVGKTLRGLLGEHGPIPVPAVADIGIQICRSLDEAHRHGIVHRDLKPDNVFVCDDGAGRPLVRVIDYGCARLAHGAEVDGPVPEMQTLTVVGTLIGTPMYMSPEQCMGSEIDHRSDLYSLGVMMFEMLSGHVPFEDQLQLRLLSRHITEPAPRVTGPQPIPEALVGMVDRLLRKAPEDRPQHALDVLDLLLDLLESQEHRTYVTYDGGLPDDTQVTAPPYFRLAAEATMRDLVPPGAEFTPDDAPDEDHTVPWNRPIGTGSGSQR